MVLLRSQLQSILGLTGFHLTATARLLVPACKEFTGLATLFPFHDEIIISFWGMFVIFQGATTG